jgi:hypothetical protein
MPVTEPNDDIKAAISDGRLLERSALDCVEALMWFACVGHSIPDAIVALDHLCRQLEKANQS